LVGEQPQAPIKHEFGKSPVELQHNDVLMLPLESTQVCSFLV